MNDMTDHTNYDQSMKNFQDNLKQYKNEVGSDLKDRPSVEPHFQRLKTAIDGVQELVDTIQTRLTPILTPVLEGGSPEFDAVASRQYPQSPVADLLDDRIGSLNVIKEQLHDLLDRLEL